MAKLIDILKQRDDWNQIEKGLNEGYLKIEKALGSNRLWIKDLYDRWWSLYYQSSYPNTFENYKGPTRYDNSYLNLNNLTQKDFYIDYTLKLSENWDKIDKGLREGYLRISYNYRSYHLEVKDFIYSRWFSVNKYENLENFIPTKYHKTMVYTCNLTQEEFFIDYYLKLRDDWDKINNGLNNGYLRIKKCSDGANYLEIKDIYNRWWILKPNRYPKDFINFKGPKMYKSSMLCSNNLTQEIYFIDYTLKLRDDWCKIEEGLNDGYLRIIINDEPRAYLQVRDINGIWYSLDLRRYPKEFKNYQRTYNGFELIMPYSKAINIKLDDIEFTDIEIKDEEDLDRIPSGTSIIYVHLTENGKMNYVAQTINIDNERDLIKGYLCKDIKIVEKCHGHKASEWTLTKVKNIDRIVIKGIIPKNSNCSNRKEQIRAYESILNKQCIMKQ